MDMSLENGNNEEGCRLSSQKNAVDTTNHGRSTDTQMGKWREQEEFQYFQYFSAFLSIF